MALETACVFCGIGRGDVPATVVHETEHTIAFRDLDPRAPTHVLVVPKAHVTHAGELSGDHGELLAELFLAANAVAVGEGVSESGYRLVLNVGEDGGNTVAHLHLHVLGGRPLAWPPG